MINMSSFLINQEISDYRFQIVDFRNKAAVRKLISAMDNDSKIQLSNFEMDLLNNSEWILTKNGIMKKAQRLLEQVQQNVSDYTKLHLTLFPAEVLAISPKISKGENYLGLPWLILDFPRHFDKENIFAIRTMFWWGHFFSTTLHLSGKYKVRYTSMVTNAFAGLGANDYYVCVHDEQWHHHMEPENYLPVKDFSAVGFADHISKASFLKLAHRLSFSQWDHAVQRLSENFVRIARWLN
jgi:hypothetical protein